MQIRRRNQEAKHFLQGLRGQPVMRILSEEKPGGGDLTKERRALSAKAQQGLARFGYAKDSAKKLFASKGIRARKNKP